MNQVSQFGPGISETPEQLKIKQAQEASEKEKQAQEEKYSKEFSEKIHSTLEAKLNNLDSSLVNNNEKQTIISRLEAVYINNKSKGLEFNLDKELIKIINSMSFETAGKPISKDYLQKNQEIRKKIIKQINNIEEKLEISQKKENLPEEKKQAQNSEKYKENPLYPIIERLHNQQELSNETFNQIQEILSSNNNLNLDQIKFQNNKEKETLEGYLNNLNFDNLNRKQNLLELTQDIKKIPDLKDLKIEINNDGSFKQEILNKIGKNYIKIPDSNGNFDIQQDFSTAILTTKNEILKEVKNLKKDSETYKQAIKNINSGNLKKQLEGINSLYVLAYSNEGVLGKKTIEQYKNSRKNNLIKEAKQLELQLQQQKLTEKQKQQLEIRKKEIQQELSEITGIKDGKKISGGDIFKATKQETNDSGLEKEQSK